MGDHFPGPGNMVETVAVYDPHLADSIPAWVVDNIQDVCAYMKKRGCGEWTIAGVRSQSAHAREVDRAVANERVRDVHTCHDQCTKTELCRMTRRAEAAEADARRYRWLRSNLLWCNGYDNNIRWAVEIPQAPPDAQAEGHKLHARINYKLDKAIDAAIASGGEDRKA